MDNPMLDSPEFYLESTLVSARAKQTGEGFLVLAGSLGRFSGLIPDLSLGSDQGKRVEIVPGEKQQFRLLVDILFRNASEATGFLERGTSTASSSWHDRRPDGLEGTYGDWKGERSANHSPFERAAEWLLTQSQNLENEERRYKLLGAHAVKDHLGPFLNDKETGRINLNVRNALNLLGWRTVGALNAVVNRAPEVFWAALRQAWIEPKAPLTADRFWELLEPALVAATDDERRALSGKGTRASIASYLLFVADPTAHPFYRPTFGGEAVEWLCEARLAQQSAGQLLDDYVTRCRDLLTRFIRAGVPLADMLDLQGALYLIKRHFLETKAEVLDPLKVEFETFQTDLVARLRTQVRQVRARQLRQLLSDPKGLTLEAFNTEVWRFHRQTRLDDRDVTGEVYSDALTPERAAQLSGALEDGRLHLQGNYSWSSGSTVFGAALKMTAKEKLSLVLQAAELLTRPDLSPVDKARQIDGLPGFGPNVSTGLVMIFHSDEFALMNRRSQEALVALGQHVTTLEAFQESASTIRTRVGATDFIELDSFLFGRGDGRHTWWVNQGRTYTEERDGEYVWASQESGRLLQHHENVARLRPGDQILHYAGGAILALGTVTAPSADVDDDVESSSIPGKRQGYLARVNYQEFGRPVKLADLPANLRRLKPGPFDQNGDVLQGYLFPVDPEVLEYVKSQIASAPPLTLEAIGERVNAEGLRVSARTLRRYHLSLRTRGFVVLSGISGTGKTWLAEAYARATAAEVLVAPVAPNWTSNEDLLGFHSPLDGGHYYHTPVSRFLIRAVEVQEAATIASVEARQFHLVLDEMNLARVEHYFAQFLSMMEVHARGGTAMIRLGPDLQIPFPSNLSVIGTVNVDETTHDFADKVYDRAQLIELQVTREDLALHLAGQPHAEILLPIWDAVSDVTPFAFRVMDEITRYIEAARALGFDPYEALDDAVLQKILPKLRGTDSRLLDVLSEVMRVTEGVLPMSHARAKRMHTAGMHHGFVSFH